MMGAVPDVTVSILKALWAFSSGQHNADMAEDVKTKHDWSLSTDSHFLVRRISFYGSQSCAIVWHSKPRENLPAGYGSTNTSIPSISQMSLFFVLNTQETSVILSAATSDHVEAESTLRLMLAQAGSNLIQLLALWPWTRHISFLGFS